MSKLSNRDIASIFATVADMLEIKGESIHRILAYRRAAETIGDLTRDLQSIYDEGTLTDLPHIGGTLADKIEELLTTGELEFYKRLAGEIPPGLVDMLQIPGLGPKKVALFWKELDITSIDELKLAASEGKLRVLSGMGAKSEQKVIDGIEALARRSDRAPLGTAYPLAMRLLEHLLAQPGAIKGDIAGSLRRRKPTIGDIDILIASDAAAPIMQAFIDMDEVSRVIVEGPTKTSVELINGQQADLRVLPEQHYGTLLSYFTGSKEHNVRLRELALKKGLSLNEMAFSHVEGDGDDILCPTEEDVYRVLGLPYIAPELREDRGEIEAAQAGSLPDLITEADILGDLHLHTTWSDGSMSVLEMAKAAMAAGRQYMMVTDHSYGLGMVSGLKPGDIAAQRAEIDRANAELGGAFTVLHGTECEIRADGTLDWNDEELAMFDIVIASLHTSLRQPREQITERLLRAIENPYVRIIGHPRGQQIPDREPADLDMEQVFAAAREHGVALEINSNPRRLDLDDVHARRAIELGVKLSINTDSHTPQHFGLLHYGVATARRGWVTASDVINTLRVDELLDWVKGQQA